MSPEMGRYTLEDDNAIMAIHSADFGLHKLVVRKTADEIVNNSVVLQDDDDLFFPLGANEVWHAVVILRLISAGAAQFKFGFTVPAGAVGERLNTYNGALSSQAIAAAVGIATTAANEILVIHLIVVNGALAGNLQLQWAQNAANVSDTTVFENSCIIATQLV